MRPMKYHLASRLDLERMLKSENYAVEPKLDGVRCLACIEDGEVQLLNSSGVKMVASSTNRYRPAIITALKREFAEGHWTFDGELMSDGKLYFFDIIKANDLITVRTPLFQRRQALELIAKKRGWGSEHILRIVSHATNEQDKRNMLDTIAAGGGEGVMLKKLDSSYSEGRVRHSLKWKLTKTADVIVSARNVDGKCNAEMQLLSNGRGVPIGSVSMHGKENVAVGGVIEVKFLYVSEAGHLVQPRMIRARPDKAAADCTIDQLENLTVNKTVATMEVLV